MRILKARIVFAASITTMLLCAGCSSLTEGGTTEASCVGPYLDDQPPGGGYGAAAPTVSPGETITIYGHWYSATCNDAGQDRPIEALPPARLSLTLPSETAGKVGQQLGEFTPSGRDMGFAVDVQVPTGTPAGTATVRDASPAGATYEFEVGR